MNRSGFISLKKRFASLAARSTPAIFQLFGDAIAIGLALPVFIQLGFFTGFYSISFPLYDVRHDGVEQWNTALHA